MSETSSTQKNQRTGSVLDRDDYDAFGHETTTKVTPPLFSHEVLSSQVIKSLEFNSISNFGSINQLNMGPQHHLLLSQGRQVTIDQGSQINPTASFNTVTQHATSDSLKPTTPVLFDRNSLLVESIFPVSVTQVG